MGNEGSYSSEHDTAFKSLISDIDEDLTIHKKAFLMTQLLKKYLSYLPDHIPMTYPVTKYRTKFNIIMVIRLRSNLPAAYIESVITDQHLDVCAHTKTASKVSSFIWMGEEESVSSSVFQR